MKLICRLIITALLLIIPNGFGSEVPISLSKNKTPLVNTITDTVTATIYNRGRQTASGKWLDQKNPKRHKIIAISRDLIEQFNFGDSVFIIGANEYDGIYAVEDLMNKRWKKRIDILINPRDGLNKFYNVRIFKIQ